MIYINRLLGTKVGWSFLFQDRLERGIRELNAEVIFYPNSRTSDNFNALVGQVIGLSSMLWLDKNKKNITEEDRFIFLDSMQNVSGQLLVIDKNVLFEVYVHLSKSCREFIYSNYYYMYNEHFPNILVGCKETGKSYGSDYRVVGAPVERFIPNLKDNYCLWSGSSIHNPLKKWDDFIKVVEYYPEIEFMACLPYIEKVEIEHKKKYLNLTIETTKTFNNYLELIKKAKWILSTSIMESFGMTIFDGISTGSIPLCKSVGAFKEYLPSKFLFKDVPDFSIKTNEYELSEIIKPFYAVNFAKRLIGNHSL